MSGMNRDQVGAEYDRRATRRNFDTTHTSRPDAEPMWDDLDPETQDKMIEVAWEEGWVE